MESQRPVQQCPHCKLPLTRQESREPTCPLCREPLYAVAPDPDDLPDVDDIEADGDDILQDESSNATSNKPTAENLNIDVDAGSAVQYGAGLFVYTSTGTNVYA